MFSSVISKKISLSISSLSEHIRAISERNFNNKISLSVDDELQEFVTNINQMSDKLHQYDKAQKTFLQNISHEFRTPLMSIQGYTEGIKYDIIDCNSATHIIMDETKHLTKLVEDLLYLSRLDAIEENYSFNTLDINELLSFCIQRVNGIAIKSNIKIIFVNLDKNIEINCDEEKLCRAVTNILTNCIRYANNVITMSLEIIENSKVGITIKDDGVGFEDSEIPYIFNRFFMGPKGNFGLGLTITKTIIEKHKGIIKAVNSDSGAVFIIEIPII
ncbi:MAG: sensor histidine kinase [Clostridiaceae bacterium]